jgi:hypothetical protein
MLSVIMLNIVMLSVIMLSVIEQKLKKKHFYIFLIKNIFHLMKHFFFCNESQTFIIFLYQLLPHLEFW